MAETPNKFAVREDLEVFFQSFQQQLDRRFDEIRELQQSLFKQLELRVEGAEKLEQERIACICEMGKGDTKMLEAKIAGVRNEIEAIHRELKIESEAAKAVVTKSEIATEKRFDAVNEFRAQMADQAGLFISRREVEALVNSNSEKISSITDRLNRNEGRGMGISQLGGWIFGGVGLVVGLIAIFSWLSHMQPTIDRNSEFRQQAAPVIQGIKP
jgi:Skp family chaperone for outer membrane proteins